MIQRNSSELLIDLKRVLVRKDGNVVLRRVSWSSRRGEHWFVMGANGSGKTTLMELLAGYAWPWSGKASVLGGEFGHTNLLELRARVGYVSPWVIKHLGAHVPVHEVVASGVDGSVGFYGRKTKALSRAVQYWLSFFGAGTLAGRGFGDLSSGEQLKVLLARALVGQPELLILDEPFSLLDAGSRIRMYGYFEKLGSARNAPQVILVTHHAEDVLPFFTHGLLLKKGTVLAQGARTHVLTPRHLAQCFNLALPQARRFLTGGRAP